MVNWELSCSVSGVKRALSRTALAVLQVMLVLNLPRKLLPLILLISLILAALSRSDISSLGAQTRPSPLEANGRLGAQDFPDLDKMRDVSRTAEGSRSCF